MIHYVYKTTNLVNGKFYIGVKTNSRHYDDGYFGSGFLLNKAIKKYGYKNFQKEVLWHFGTAEECFKKESEIVTEEFVKSDNTYNIALGGKGGDLGPLANQKKSQKLKGHKVSDETKQKISKANKGNKVRLGASHTEESRKKISEYRRKHKIAKGKNNPMYGKNHTEESKNKMRKPHKTTGPKIRLSCLGCCKETTVNAYWRHEDCGDINA